MLDALDFLHGAYFPRCKYRVDKRFDRYCTLQFMVDGDVELFYDDEVYEMKGSWMWTCQPGSRIRFHVARHAHHWPHRYVALSGSQIHHWKLTRLWFDTPQQIDQPEYFAELFDELLAYIKRRDRWSNRLAQNTLERILLEVAQTREAQKLKGPLLKSTLHQSWLDLVHQRLSEIVSEGQNETAVVYQKVMYEKLAAECGMSLSHLRTSFQQAVGVPLHTFVLQRRVAVARDLLANTDLPLKAIAAQLGYSDSQFFSRQFRRFTGQTPGEYRNKHRNNYRRR